MKLLKISCQTHKIGSLIVSSRYKTNYIKNLFISTEAMKVVENLLRKDYGETLNNMSWKDML